MGTKILLLLLIVAGCQCQSTKEIAAKIPENLKECYNGSNMMVKDNLLPMTMKVFIQLIKKLEDYTVSASTRTLVPSLLKRFRFDGIQRSPNVLASDLVIPYSPRGNEFHLYKTLMQYFISNTGQEIANDTFSLIERCTLHQMLSISVDPWERPEGDSVCGRLSKYPTYNLARRPRRSTGTGPAPKAGAEQALVGAPPRTTTPDDEVELLNPKKEGASDEHFDEKQSGNFLHNTQDTDYPLSGCPMENGVIFQKSGAICPGVLLAGIAAGLQPQKVQPVTILDLKTRSGRGGGVPSPRKTFQQPPASRRGYRVRGQAGTSAPGGWPSGGGGGAVPQPSEIDNRWAATISGLLAEVALLQGPVVASAQHYKIGIDGGWNDTTIPRYYFLTDQVGDGLTTARIRGAVDGLIIASNIDNWNAQSGSELKLSQLLEMYYSDSGVFDKNMKACNRQSYIGQAMPRQDMKTQTYSFMKVLQDDLPGSVEIEDEGLWGYSDEASQQLASYIPSMSDPPCPLTSFRGPSGTLTSRPVADLNVVVDCSWDDVQLFQVVAVLSLKMAWLTYPKTNVTVINGKTGLEMFSAGNLIDALLSESQVCNNSVPTGFDMRVVMNRLKLDMGEKLEWEKKVGNLAGTVPRIVLFLPASSSVVPDSDKWYVQDKLAYFKAYNPDVKFLYLVPGSKDRFTPYADNPDKDVFTINQGEVDLSRYIEPLVNRVSEIPRRIINPTCGASWSSGSYGTLQLNGYLGPNEVHYYRVQPNYFYKDANAKVSVQSSDNTIVLNVCSSRNNGNPVANNSGSGSGSVNCRQVTGGRGVDMWLSDSLCPNSLAIRCDPFYFSVSASQASQSASSISRCIDPDCETPMMTKYVISHQGFSCYSSVTNIVASPIVIVLTILASLVYAKY